MGRRTKLDYGKSTNSMDAFLIRDTFYLQEQFAVKDVPLIQILKWENQ